MARNSPFSAFLFWIMFLLGGGALAACLILPVWIEHASLRRLHAEMQRRVQDLEQRLLAYERQNEHLEKDPAYIERLARKEFGIVTPGVESVRVEIAPPDISLASQPTPAPSDPADELADRVRVAARENALVSIFVLDQTRPLVMAFSGGLLLVALVSFNWPRQPAPLTSLQQPHEQ